MPIPTPQYRRSINSAQILCRLGTDHGIPLALLLKGTDINPAMLHDSAAEIEASQEMRMIHNLQACGRHIPGLGMEAGQRYHLTTYGIWGFALASSPTVRSAIDIALRYVHLTFTFAHYSVHEKNGDALLSIDDSTIPEAVRTLLLERDLVGVRNLFVEALGMTVQAKYIHLRMPRPAYADAMLALFGQMPLFDQAQNCVAFDASLLDFPLPQANEHTKHMCETMCRELLQRRRARQGLAGRIRDRMLQMPIELPDMETIATEFHMTSRSLRRHLDKEGTSFRALSDEIRETLAEQLLRDGLTVEEIAGRLGYTESSSFTQAFKRWKGMSPKAYRVSQGGSSRVNRTAEE